MTSTSPITPPPELVQQWIQQSTTTECTVSQVAVRAAQWGADHELEACCIELTEKIITNSFYEGDKTECSWRELASIVVRKLRAARRPASKVYEINEPLKLTPRQQEAIAALLRPDPKPAVKGPLLVTRVAAAISQDGEPINWAGAYAAIREVAAWMREQHDGDLVAATVLEREAER